MRTLYISEYGGALHPYTLPFALYIKAVPSITKFFELYSLFSKKLKKYFSEQDVSCPIYL